MPRKQRLKGSVRLEAEKRVGMKSRWNKRGRWRWWGWDERLGKSGKKRKTTRRWKESGEPGTIKIKPAAKMWAFRVSVTDKSVRKKWGFESKHQFMLRCDRAAWFATRPYWLRLLWEIWGDTGLRVCAVGFVQSDPRTIHREERKIKR